MLVKISLENFEGKLEKFSDIGDVAGVIAVRKSKQFLEITIFRTQKTPNGRFRLFSHDALNLRHPFVLLPATTNSLSLISQAGKDCQILLVLSSDNRRFFDNYCTKKNSQFITLTPETLQGTIK